MTKNSQNCQEDQGEEEIQNAHPGPTYEGADTHLVVFVGRGRFLLRLVSRCACALYVGDR